MIGRATFELLLRFMPISAVWATAAAAEPIANNVVEFNIVPLAEDLIFMSSPDDDPSVKENQ